MDTFHLQKKTTALALACGRGYKSIVEVLIEKDAMLNLQDTVGQHHSMCSLILCVC